MPTFIDESGDTGNAEQGGKPYFRLAAVWVPSLDEAEVFRAAVQQLRGRLKLRGDYEFKFFKTHASMERRQAFFETAMKREFRFAVCSIDKTADYWSTASGSEQHWACATTLSVCLRPVYQRSADAKGGPLREPVVADNNSDRDFLNIIKRQFRGLKSSTAPNVSLVGPVSFRKSSAEELLQLADMICGAVGEYLDGGEKTWHDLIAVRSVGMVTLP